MDPGTVVWLPGAGLDEDAACQAAYGYYYYACGEQVADGGIIVYCCPY
jgi:hypothetical protein